MILSLASVSVSRHMFREVEPSARASERRIDPSWRPAPGPMLPYAWSPLTACCFAALLGALAEQARPPPASPTLNPNTEPPHDSWARCASLLSHFTAENSMRQAAWHFCPRARAARAAQQLFVVLLPNQPSVYSLPCLQVLQSPWPWLVFPERGCPTRFYFISAAAVPCPL